MTEAGPLPHQPGRPRGRGLLFWDHCSAQQTDDVFASHVSRVPEVRRGGKCLSFCIEGRAPRFRGGVWSGMIWMIRLESGILK